MHTRTLAVALAILAAAGLAARAADAPTRLTSAQPPLKTIDESLRNEVNAAIDRGLAWLLAQQQPDGAWSDVNYPALTAFPVWALAQARTPAREEALNRGVASILRAVREDGGIYRDVEGRKGGGLSNYNTAISMTALHAVRRPELVPVVQKARAFIAGAQHLGEDVYKGGFGYDRRTNRAYTDLLNTFYAAQAMRLTQDVEDRRAPGEARVDVNWKETAAYVDRLQSKPESGEANAGGFVYNPSDPKAGTLTNAAGVVYFRSYGSITYAGLLALIYANVDRADPRVNSALDWSARHWSLDENPGMGAEGLFFFYNVLARAMTAAERDFVPRPDGATLNWRAELAKKLVSIQKVDPKTGNGFWINESNRFMESDPVLVTCYALLALQNL